jgi:hypothetical protein
MAKKMNEQCELKLFTSTSGDWREEAATVLALQFLPDCFWLVLQKLSKALPVLPSNGALFDEHALMSGADKAGINASPEPRC